MVAFAVALAVASCGGAAPLKGSPQALPPTEGPWIVTPPATTPIPTPSGPELVAIGKPITLSALDGTPAVAITVSKVAVLAKVGSGYAVQTPGRAGDRFVVAFITYKAFRDGIRFGAADWQLFVGTTLVTGFQFNIYGPKPRLEFGTLPAGRTGSGWLMFEVPKTGEVRLSYGGAIAGRPAFEVILRKR
jgi:hypothetical protein